MTDDIPLSEKERDGFTDEEWDEDFIWFMKKDVKQAIKETQKKFKKRLHEWNMAALDDVENLFNEVLKEVFGEGMLK
jgi:predicted HNH restriction endonuclease